MAWLAWLLASSLSQHITTRTLNQMRSGRMSECGAGTGPHMGAGAAGLRPPRSSRTGSREVRRTAHRPHPESRRRAQYTVAGFRFIPSTNRFYTEGEVYTNTEPGSTDTSGTPERPSAGGTRPS
ncbi:hypothetical protein B0H11DRAFT_1905269 [Mycena galericulata]|nr:hypothetical protein B0H11DRAFT_1905269 [Mycena galericulata]